jgi:hypothetical protein
MSQFSSPFGSGLGQPGAASQAGQQPVQQRPVLASYRTYEEAQRAVDYLSDQKFPVENLGIVGRDLKIAETVLGRLTYGRAALSGLATGAWFGLFVGLLLGIFAPNGRAWLTLGLYGLLFGAVFGVVYGVVAFAFTGGRRDFSSTSRIVATTYDVVCTWSMLDQAQAVLATLGTGGGPATTAGGPSAPGA